MCRLAWTSIMVAVMITSSMAHHGYGEYDRNAAATLEGTVKRVLWTNPHVVLTLYTREGLVYSVGWAAVAQFSIRGIGSAHVVGGENVFVTGSINRFPEKRSLTVLQEIRRPADGWQWISPARARQCPPRG